MQLLVQAKALKESLAVKPAALVSGKHSPIGNSLAVYLTIEGGKKQKKMHCLHEADLIVQFN